MEEVHKRILYEKLLTNSCLHLSSDVWLHDLLQCWFRWFDMQVIFARNMWNNNILPADSWDKTDSQVRQKSWIFLRVLEHLWLTSHYIILHISNPNFCAKRQYMDKDSIMLHCAIRIRKSYILYENIWKVRLLGVNVNPGVYRSQVLPNFLLHVHYNICSLTLNRHWQRSSRKDQLWINRHVHILLDGL